MFRLRLGLAALEGIAVARLNGRGNTLAHGYCVRGFALQEPAQDGELGAQHISLERDGRHLRGQQGERGLRDVETANATVYIIDTYRRPRPSSRPHGREPVRLAPPVGPDSPSGRAGRAAASTASGSRRGRGREFRQVAADVLAGPVELLGLAQRVHHPVGPGVVPGSGHPLPVARVVRHVAVREQGVEVREAVGQLMPRLRVRNEALTIRPGCA